MRKIGFLLIMTMLLAMSLPVQAEELLTQQSESIQELPSEELPQPHEHNWGEGTVTTEATCTQNGVKTYVCSCSETKTEELPAVGHAWGSWQPVDDHKHNRECTACHITEEAFHSLGNWQTNADSHYKNCGDCGYTDSENHLWGSSIVLEKPTCKDQGVLGYVCSVCNVLREEPISKLNVHTYDSACDPKCNICDYTRVTEHDVEKVWVKDASGHWYACTKCDEKISYEKHTPGPDATEEKEQLCTTCRYVIAAKKKHTHSFNKKWTNDETGHWYACKTCNAEKDYAAHTYDNVCDSDCNICGFEKDAGHTYYAQWQTTKWEHWNVCSVCGEESEHEKHIAGPQASEEAAQVCTKCGYELAAKLIHSHDFIDNWEWDTENHWHICKCGETSVAQPHLWDEGTEVRDHILEYHCVSCGAQKMEKAERGFPWVILLVILAMICLGGMVVLLYMYKKGSFEEEQEEYEDLYDVLLESSDNAVEASANAEDSFHDDLKKLLKELSLDD